MSDVFISYARRSEPQAQAVAAALREHGFSVWRDDDLSAHQNFTREIAEQLAAAKAVLVIWCADAVRSEWVQSEADRARQDRKLVQIRIDQAPLPMPFDRIQCVDLADGSLDTPGWRKVLASLNELTGAGLAAVEPVPGAAIHGLSRPTIAVMPFANLSSDPDQAYFSDGIVEEIVAALSRYRSLGVAVAAGATMAADGRPLSPQEAARALGVRYILDGSVRKAGARVRITLHLVDGETGTELWTDRLEDDSGDIFALQDKVAERVAGAAEGAVQDADMRKITARPTGAGSYDLYMRALFLFRTSRRAEIAQALELLDESIALDPNFGLGLSFSSICLRQMVDHGWTDDPLAARRKGIENAERALRVAPDQPRVIAEVAMGLPGLDGHMGRALPLIERAIALNPSSGFIWLASGSLHLRNGDPQTATTHLETATRLDPISSMNGFMRAYLASARFQLRRFDEAMALFQTTTYRLPVSYLVLASLHGRLGQLDLARQALAEFERAEAGSVDHLVGIWFPRPENRQLLFEGLQPLGLAPPAPA